MANEIPEFYAQATIQFVQRPREELEALLQDLSLPMALLGDERMEGQMAAEDYGRLFMGLLKLAQRSLYDEPEQVVDLSTYRLMFSYMIQAETLEAAIERAANYFRRFHERKQSFSLVNHGDKVCWRFHLDKPGEEAVPEATLEHFSMDSLHWLPGLVGRMLALYTWHRLCSWLVGNFVDLEAVNLDYPLEGDADDYTQAFRSPVYFNRPNCSLTFHPRYLAMPVVRKEADLNRMLETFPAELMQADQMMDSTAAQVRGLLGNDYSDNLPSLEDVAALLFTTAPTLHRRLRAEGTSYQKIKDTCRRDAAIQLIRSGGFTGAVIAEKLGFSDASTFYRAFKKWTDLTPQEFLQQES